jgi:ribosomal protein S18 acetylase RimI-like enzyme
MHRIYANPGLSTDLALLAASGQVTAYEHGLAVRTPLAPDYFFGNLLILSQRPAENDLARLEGDFARLIDTPPTIAHRTFMWPESDTETDAVDLGAFAAHGYDTTVCRVLQVRPEALHVPVVAPALTVRPFAVQRDWDDWHRMHLANMPDPADGASQRYLAYQQANFRRLIDQGHGDWWGAFDGDEQVGNLGLFIFDGVARFQTVITAPAHRNRKVCRTLLRTVVEHYAGRAAQFVIVADETYHAAALYESIGFRRHARLASLCRTPDKDRPAA